MAVKIRYWQWPNNTDGLAGGFWEAGPRTLKEELGGKQGFVRL
jgi:hypothetical protein